MPQFPREGIKLSSLESFINECGGRSLLKGLSTSDICEKHVKPLTFGLKSSYCDYVKTINPNSVDEAQVFISHAWKYKFLDVVDTLRHHFWEKPDVFIWLDLFSNNQHYAPAYDFLWWSTTFKSAIEHFNHTVLIWSPWNNPIPLTRAWCLFEIFCTAECNCKFEIAMSSSDKIDFLKAIEKGVIESINTALATIDTRKSESTDPNDKNLIFRAVEGNEKGFTRINSLVLDSLREWIIKEAEEYLEKCSTETDRAYAQLSLGMLYMSQGKYKSAEDNLTMSMTTLAAVLGERNSDTLHESFISIVSSPRKF